MKQFIQPFILQKVSKPAVIFLLISFTLSQTQAAPLFAASGLAPQDQAPYLPVKDPQNPGSAGFTGTAALNDPTADFMSGQTLGNSVLNPAPEGEAGAASIAPLPPGVSKPVTNLPKNSGSRKVPLGSYVSYDPSQGDWSNLSVMQSAPDRTAMHFNLYNTTSYTGVFADYDDIETQAVESINFNSLFANGIVFGMDNGGSDLTEVLFGVQDVLGNVDWVTLSGIEASERLWEVDLENFTVADLSQIQTVFFEIDGRHVNGQFNLHWGDFYYTPKISSLPDNPTQPSSLPRLSNGKKPLFNSYNSFDPSFGDWSNSSSYGFSTQETKFEFNTYNTDSYAVISAVYDDESTAPVETIDFTQLFPEGLVTGLRNDGTEPLSELYFFVVDAAGDPATVKLTEVSRNRQYYKIALSDLLDVDLTKITEVGFVYQGRLVNGKLNIHFGNFEVIPSVVRSSEIPGVVPRLPLLASGAEPVPSAEVSFFPHDASAPDWSNQNLSVLSPSTAQWDFNLYNTYSSASVNILYDTPRTPGKTISYTDAFVPAGLVIGLDNGGMGDVKEALLRVEDSSGRVDDVKLDQITRDRQYFTIPSSLMESVDLTKLISLSILVEGRHVGGRLNIYLPGLGSDNRVSGTVFNESEVSALSPSAQIFTSGGSYNGQTPGEISWTALGADEYEYRYGLWNGDHSYALLNIRDGSFQENGNFVGASLELPNKFVLAAKAGEAGEAKIVITDTQHRQAIFHLDLEAFYQNYELLLSGNHVPEGFDRRHVAQIEILHERYSMPPGAWSDLVKVKLKGLNIQPPALPADLLAFKAEVIEKGLGYFDSVQGIDPVTHLPYDRTRADGTVEREHQIVQPTLAGFYLQMLGDFIRGKMDWPGMTKDEALDRIDAALGGLLQIQSAFGWKGLIPWVDQGVPYPVVGIGDNANLAQSIAVMVGALEMAPLTAIQRDRAGAITLSAEHFLDLQAPGYAAAVDPSNGLFYGAIYRSSGAAVYHMDRLITEFRGAIAFLLIRYPQLPRSVWDNLTVQKDTDYVDRNGNRITNLQSYEGGAFQYFWPLLRNNERDFVGLRNALESYFNTQTDYAAVNHIPGFLSASDMPGHAYAGLIGIPQLAETQDPLVVDLGSTYALASAYAVNPYHVLSWLKKIRDRNPALYGRYGFLDSARSNSEVAQFYLGIDVASTLLALNNAGPEAFEHYLRNRNKEQAYNNLYDKAAQFGLERTWTQPAETPELPDRSYSVFSHVLVDGTLGNFPYSPTTPQGVRLAYNGFGTTFDGRYWELENTYDAQANLFEIYYSINNPPGKIRLEFKDDTPEENVIYSLTVALPASAVKYQKLEIQLPNSTALAKVKKVFLIIDQSTGDTRGDFTLHAVNFKHFLSAQNLSPLSQSPVSGSTTVNETYGMELLSSSPNSSLEIISPKLGRLHYDIPQSGGYAAVSLNADPDGDGQGVFDLSKKSKVVFGLNSATVRGVKIEVDDAFGNRAVFYASGVDVARNYYEFLTASLQGSIDITKVKRISFVVDQSLANSGALSGLLDVEIL